MYITDGIILKKEAAGEADLLITALTDRFVRVRLVAQGARKASAKLKGHLEPLSLSRLSFVAGRNGYRLVGAELVDFFRVIKSAPERFRIASEIISILDSALFEDVAGESGGFFALARDVLVFLNEPSKTPEECDRAFLWFRTQFLKESGLLPEAVLGLIAGNKAGFASCADFVSLCGEPQGAMVEKEVSLLFKTHLPN